VRSGLSDRERRRDEVDRRKGALLRGLHCSALRVLTSKRTRFARHDAIAGAPSRRASFLENCIEKNFHVPNMRAGPCAEHGLQFQKCVP